MILAKPKRVRDSAYLKWIRTLSCCVHPNCPNSLSGPVEAHHIRPEGHGGLGTKPSDFRALPFCETAHRTYHAIGRKAFESTYQVDLEHKIDQHRAIYFTFQKPR